MNYFPNGDEEISLLRFIAAFEYINEKDTKYFFSSRNYYRKRIASLVDKRYIRKIKSNFVLDEMGIEYVQSMKMDYYALNRNVRYLPRLLYISHLAAVYYPCPNIKYIASRFMKNEEVLTNTGRKYVGILEIDGLQYLTYHISKKNENQYITSVIYDLQKEKNYEYIIIFVDDINRINIEDFAFGKDKVLIMEDTKENENNLKYLNKVRWSRIIKEYYDDTVFLSPYNFCDYTNKNDKYISIFNFIDAEKITRIKYFLMESNNRNVDIICDEKLEPILRKELPDANYVVVDLNKYTMKEKNYYD